MYTYANITPLGDSGNTSDVWSADDGRTLSPSSLAAQ